MIAASAQSFRSGADITKSEKKNKKKIHILDYWSSGDDHNMKKLTNT